MKQPKIGIIGYGMVGKAVGDWFTKAAIYSPHQYPDGMTGVNQADIIFLTVPTPYNARTGYRMDLLEGAIKKIKGRKIVVLKSTVLPGTAAQLQKKFPRHIWLFNPEFLRDKWAAKDFREADRQIIGLAKNTAAHRAAAKLVMKILPKAPYEAITTSTEAELVKLFANAFGSTKVVFANMIYDACKRLGADYELVKLGITHDARIGPSWMDVMYEGFRGYSGKCFPKDMGALIWYGKKTKHRFPLLEVADAINWKMLPAAQKKR